MALAVRIILWIFVGITKFIYIPINFCNYFKKSEYCPPIKNDVLLWKTETLATKIRKKEIKCTKVIDAYIKRITEVNQVLNAVVDERFDLAMEDAQKVDDFLQTTDMTESEVATKYPLLGVPLTVKGSIALQGVRFSSGSLVRKDIIAENDAECVKKIKEAGAIPLVVTNTPEFCINWETYNKLIGTTRNPYNTTRTVGGSSGGEVALLATAGSLIGVGSDIAGSLRLPAHFCGVWGHKPTPGLVSYVGHYPSCKQEDVWREVFTLGPMARYATDLRILLQVMSNDPQDPVFSKKVDIKDIKVYYVEEINNSLMDTTNNNVKKAVKQVIEHFDTVCSDPCKKVNFKHLNNASTIAYFDLAQTQDVDNLFPNNGDGCYAELLRFFFCLSKSSFSTILYGVLKKVMNIVPKKVLRTNSAAKEKLRSDFLGILDDRSVFILPTFAHEAGYHYSVFRNLFNYGYCALFNSLGFPVTNCPVLMTKDGLPVGLQVVAAPGCDHLSLSIAEEIERTFGGWKQPPWTTI